MSNARTLADRLADLLRRERFAMADFLVALAEFDTAICIYINHISTARGGDGFVHHGR